MMLVTVLFAAFAFQFVHSTEVICYFTSWSIYRQGVGKFNTSMIDPKLCTIINYAYVGVSSDTGKLRVMDEWATWNLSSLKNVTDLKEINKNLKVLVAMGGWKEGSANFSKVAANATLRKNMVASVLSFINDNKLDGFALDWNYPTIRSGISNDPTNFNTLLSELKSALKPKRYILTISVAGAGHAIDTYYSVPGLFQNVDFINLNLLDLRTGDFVNYAAHHAPLFPSSMDRTTEEKRLSVSGGIQQWLDKGANASKLILGIPFYGRSFNLSNSNNQSLYAPIIGPGAMGRLVPETGVLSYQEICNFHSGAAKVWDSEQQAPHAFDKSFWYSYDDERSVSLKTKYALSKGLGGVMVWSLSYDDFSGSCGNVTYPLLKAINNALKP